MKNLTMSIIFLVLAFSASADENFNRILPSADYITSYLLKYSSLYEFGKTGTMPKDAILVILEGSKKDGTVFICFEPAKNSTFSQLR